tara:strand:- start:12216 stop:13106 length:891 start_codon:yes stop_codon:yes gene_type:complete
MTKIRYYQTNPTELLDGLASLESTAEVEAYVIVMNLIYATGGSIMPDDIRLHRYCNQTKPKLRRTLLSLVKKGKLVMIGKRITQLRCEIEIKSIQERSEKRSKAGQKGGRPKKENELNQSDKKSNALSGKKLNNKHNILNNKHDTLREKLDLDIENNFKKVWGLWRKKSGKSNSKLALRRSLQRTSFDVILNGVNQYNFQNAETEQKYILMLSTFLNQERYNDYDNPLASNDKIPKMCEWERRVSHFSKSGYWSANYGGKPTEVNKCEAPKDILEKYGYLQSNPNPKEEKPAKEKT